MPETLPRFSFTVLEAMRVTGAGKNTILNAIKRGDLEAVKRGPSGPGAKYLISSESLKRWVTPQQEVIK